MKLSVCYLLHITVVWICENQYLFAFKNFVYDVCTLQGYANIDFHEIVNCGRGDNAASKVFKHPCP